MEFPSASSSKVNNSPEERKSKKLKYETTSELELESKIPGFNIDIKNRNVKTQQDSILESSSRECKPEPGDDEDMTDSRASFAFEIDDIFEQILGSVDKASLFSCRLVSHKWRAVSTKMLKREDIYLRLLVSEDPDTVYVTFPSSYKQSKHELALFKFMLFLNETYTQGGSLTFDTFPCNALQITYCPLNHPELQSLLDVYGEHLRYLYIFGKFAQASQSESNFIKQVKHLLCVQAPNLQRLDFEGLQLKLKWATSAPVETVVETMKQNLQLRRLTLKPASRKVIDSILAMCPNLNQIDVNPLEFHVLLEPTNLFHFMREFNLDCHFGNLGNFKLIEAAILMSPEERKIQNLPPIKCTALSMNFTEVVEDFDSREDMRLRLVRIISKILESSWDTLEHIEFTRHTGNTLRGIEWPNVLLKVKRLFLQPKGDCSCGLEIFPLDGTFKIQDTFPKLENMIFRVSHDKIINSNEVDFLMKLRLGPVTSVTNVRATVLLNWKGGLGMRDILDEQLCFYSQNLLLKLFPNVSVSSKWDYVKFNRAKRTLKVRRDFSNVTYSKCWSYPNKC